MNAVEQEVQRVESPAVQAPVSNPGEHSRRLAARLWWLLLPYAGETGYADAENPARWFAHPLTWLWQLVGKLPSSAPFAPQAPIVCCCDYCLGLTDEWTP